MHDNDRERITRIRVAAAGLLTLALAAWGDEVRLKSGEVLLGTIVEESDTAVKIEVTLGKFKVKRSVPRAEIAEVVHGASPSGPPAGGASAEGEMAVGTQWKVRLKDGREFEGSVTEAGKESIKMLVRLKGGTATIVVVRGDIVESTKIKNPEEEFLDRRKAIAAGDVAALTDLALWAAEQSLEQQSWGCLTDIAAVGDAAICRQVLAKLDDAGSYTLIRRFCEHLESIPALAVVAKEEWKRIQTVRVGVIEKEVEELKSAISEAEEKADAIGIKSEFVSTSSVEVSGDPPLSPPPLPPNAGPGAHWECVEKGFGHYLVCNLMVRNPEWGSSENQRNVQVKRQLTAKAQSLKKELERKSRNLDSLKAALGTDK